MFRIPLIKVGFGGASTTTALINATLSFPKEMHLFFSNWCFNAQEATRSVLFGRLYYSCTCLQGTHLAFAFLVTGGFELSRFPLFEWLIRT